MIVTQGRSRAPKYVDGSYAKLTDPLVGARQIVPAFANLSGTRVRELACRQLVLEIGRLAT